MIRSLAVLASLLLFNTIFAQVVTDCNLNGSDELWDYQWSMPGTTEALHTMIEGPDGKIWMAGSYTGQWGGDPRINGLVSWDGEKFAQIGGSFKCTSCGLGYQYALENGANGDVYVGGFFEGAKNIDDSYVESSGIIRWNHSSQIWEAIGLGVEHSNGSRGTIRSIAYDPLTNTLYIGGDFDKTVDADGSKNDASNIAAYHLDSQSWTNLAGGVSTSEAYVDGVIYSLEMGKDKTLYVGGGMTAANGITLYSVGQWHPTDGWSTVGNGLPDTHVSNGDSNFATVYSLYYDSMSDILLAGGTFGQFSGSSSDIKFRSLSFYKDGVWTLIPGINVPGSTGSYKVSAITTNPSNGHIFIGGNFTKHVGNNSPVVNLIGEYDPILNTWNDLNNGLSTGAVTDLVFKNDELYVCGNFTGYEDGKFCRSFIKWDGQNWDNLGNGNYDPSGSIYDVSFTEDGFICVGNFSKLDFKEIGSIARWRVSSGWEALPFTLGSGAASNYNKIAYSVHQNGDWLYVGGFFAKVDGVETNGIMAYNMVSNETKIWGSGLGGGNPKIEDISTFNGDVYIVGRFDSINGISIKNIAKLNSNDEWESIGIPSSPLSRIVNIKDSILVVAGTFSNIDGDVSMKNVASYDGQTWSAFGMGIVNGKVEDIIYDEIEDAILIGGNFTKSRQTDGTYLNSKFIAKWKDGLWSEYDEITDFAGEFGSIKRLFYDDETDLVYATGFFNRAGDSDAHRIFRMNPITKDVGNLGSGLDRLETSISSSPTTGNVYFIGKQNGKLLLTGDFNTSGLNQASGIAQYTLEDYQSTSDLVSFSLPESYSSCHSVTLYAGSDDFIYEWSNGATTPTIDVSDNGTYAVTVTTLDGCSIEGSTEVTIYPNPDIQFTGISTDSIQVCDSMVLSVDGDFFEYYWSDGTFESSTNVTASGWLTVEAQDENTCVGTDSVYVTFGHSPNANFTYEIDLATGYYYINNAKDGINYDWSFGDGTTGSGTTPSHVYDGNGMYNVQVVASSNGCGQDTSSIEISIVKVDNQDLMLDHFSASPNPTNDKILLEWDSSASTEFHIQLYNSVGSLVGTYQVPPNESKMELGLSNYSKGIYLCKISSNEGSFGFKIVHE